MDILRRTSIDPNLTFLYPLVVYKVINETAHEYAKKIIEYLLNKDEVEAVFVEDLEKFSKLNQDSENIPLTKLIHFDDLSEPDICIVIGGDGTCLWSSHLFKNRKRPPFLTFNLGHLGYMSIYDCDSYKEVLDELFNKKKSLLFEKRSLLECSLKRDNEQLEYVIVLNDIIIEKTSKCHMVKLKIFVDNEPLTEVRCDGLILSTSTGSTAYSLAAGGTILHYDVDALILNSICPQSLSFRAIAFPRNITLKIMNSDENAKSSVVYDGISHFEMKDHEYVEVKLADQYVNFVLLEKFIKNRAAVWRQKIVEQLGWNNPFVNVTDKK